VPLTRVRGSLETSRRECAVQTLWSPRGGVSCLTFSPDGDLLAGLTHDTVYCWTRSRNWDKSGLKWETGHLTAVAFHPNGRTLAYAALNPRDPPPEEPQRAVRRASPWHSARETGLAPDASGVRLYALGATRELLPDVLPVPPPDHFPLPTNWLRGLAFAPDGRTLLAPLVRASMLHPTRVSLYHWRFEFEHGYWCADLAPGVTPTECGGALVGADLLALGGPWGVAVCAVEPGAPLFVPDVRTAHAVALNARRALVAVASELRYLSLHWLLEPKKLALPAEEVTALAFAPDGETLATGHGGPDRAVRFWNAASGALDREYDFGLGEVYSLAYAPDGFTLAVAGRKGLVVVDTG
jgi:WD40 repeat protein